MNLTQAIEKQELEINELDTEISILLKNGDKKSVNLAIEKAQRKELLIKQINLAKVL